MVVKFYVGNVGVFKKKKKKRTNFALVNFKLNLTMFHVNFIEIGNEQHLQRTKVLKEYK